MGERDLIALEQYDLTVLHTEKGREAMLCNTDKGLMLLREYNGSKLRVQAGAWLLNELLEKEMTDSYVYNKEGAVVTQTPEGRSYILKRWAEGREIDLKSIPELSLAVRSLANLHIFMNETEDKHKSEENLRYFEGGRDFTEDILKHHKELKHIRTYIREKRQKNAFELKALECFNLFYEQSEKILKRIEEKYNGGDIKENKNECRRLCHGNYNQHNILLCGKKIFITNFERAGFGLQVTDLYLLMRKCLEKQNWNYELGINMISEYDKVKRLSDKEKEVLVILFEYPEKFWKIVNYYYNGNKSWVSNKSISKLEALEKQEDERQRFINELRQL